MGMRLFAAIAALAWIAGAASAPAAPEKHVAPVSILDSFRIGDSGEVYCSAQNLETDRALTGMFDDGYSITCRDAALPVGKLYKIKSASNAEARLSGDREGGATLHH